MPGEYYTPRHIIDPACGSGGFLEIDTMTSYTLSQVSQILDRPISSVRRWVRLGKLKTYRIGREYIVRASVLARFEPPKFTHNRWSKKEKENP